MARGYTPVFDIVGSSLRTATQFLMTSPTDISHLFNLALRIVLPHMSNGVFRVKGVQDINDSELKSRVAGTSASWHEQYRSSAYIYVGGLDYNLTEGDIICIFSQFGEIVDLNLVRDKETGKGKGFCFIAYEDQRSTDLAVDNFNGAKVCAKTLSVDHVAKYRGPKPPGSDEDEPEEKAPIAPADVKKAEDEKRREKKTAKRIKKEAKALRKEIKHKKKTESGQAGKENAGSENDERLNSLNRRSHVHDKSTTVDDNDHIKVQTSRTRNVHSDVQENIQLNLTTTKSTRIDKDESTSSGNRDNLTRSGDRYTKTTDSDKNICRERRTRSRSRSRDRRDYGRTRNEPDRSRDRDERARRSDRRVSRNERDRSRGRDSNPSKRYRDRD
eukprot:CFRG1885T1